MERSFGTDPPVPIEMLTKQAGAADAMKRFMGRAMGPMGAPGAAGLAQKLFRSRVTRDTPFFSRVNIQDGIRDVLFGSPLDVARELRRYGRTGGGYSLPKALGRYYHRSMIPSGNWNNMSPGNKAMHGLSVGINVLNPAMNVYQAATADPEYRSEAVGRAVGSVAASPFSMRLGMPGLFLDEMAANAGGALGRRFGIKRQTPNEPPPYTVAEDRGDPR